jgi:hypothetical protein
MLQSDEAIIEDCQVTWLTDAPKTSKISVIVTMIADTTPQSSLREDAERIPTGRVPADTIVCKGKTLGDLVSPIIEEQDWQCLK